MANKPSNPTEFKMATYGETLLFWANLTLSSKNDQVSVAAEKLSHDLVEKLGESIGMGKNLYLEFGNDSLVLSHGQLPGFYTLGNEAVLCAQGEARESMVGRAFAELLKAGLAQSMPAPNPIGHAD